MFTRLLTALLCVVAHDGEALEPQYCGRHALSLVAAFVAPDAAPADWLELLPPDRAPYSLADLETAARRVGFDTLTVRWDDPRRADLSGPCVLYVKKSEASSRPDHFTACYGSDGPALLVADYPHQPAWVSRDKVQRVWSGIALYVDKPGGSRLARLRWEGRWNAARWPAIALVFGGGVVLAWRSRRRPVPKALAP